MKTKWNLQRTVRAVGISLIAVLAISLMLRVQARGALASVRQEFTKTLGPLDPRAYASPTVPDDENAAIWLRAAANALSLSDEDRDLLSDLSYDEPATWTPEQRAKLPEVLARCAPSFALLKRAAALKQTSYGLNGTEKELTAKLPLAKLLWLSRIVYIDGGFALLGGDRQRFLSDASEMPVLAVSMYREAPLISQLVGVAAEKIFLGLVGKGVMTGTLDLADVSRLNTMLIDLDLRQAWGRALAAEGTFGFTPVPEQTKLRKIGIGQEGWIEMLLSVRGFIDQPYGSRPAWASEQRAANASSPTTPAEFHATLARAAGRYQSAAAMRQLARLGLALDAEALKTGAYPATLTGLPGAATPDPFSGKPLEYEVRSDGSARLAVSNGDEIWKEYSGGFKNPPYVWELPAPPPKN